MLGNAALLAWRQIRRNLLRSFLTVLGVVIGVASVITMVTLGNGATAMVAAQIASLGTNLVMMRPGQNLGPGRDSAGAPNFKAGDVEAIASQIDGIQAVAPVVTSMVTVVASTLNWSTSVTGTSNAWYFAGNWKLTEGRIFTVDEERAGKAVCVIGATVAKQLFAGRSALGNNIRVKSFSCEVIGTLRAKGQGGIGMDQDDVLVMPMLAVQRRLTGTTDIGMILISLKDQAVTETTLARLTALMRERRRLSASEDDNFHLMDTRQLAEALSGSARTMAALLGAVATVSLLVGGIGIMNIMLVSVTERTREIGIRLAIGALEHEVLIQFLVEATVLSAIGGVLGIGLAFIACAGLTALIGMPFLFNPGINLLTFVVSAGVGIAFGYLPARRAARLNPIDALRHE